MFDVRSILNELESSSTNYDCSQKQVEHNITPEGDTSQAKPSTTMQEHHQVELERNQKMGPSPRTWESASPKRFLPSLVSSSPNQPVPRR